MRILVQDARGVRALEEGFASEEELQRFLKEHSDLMPLEEIDLNAAPLLCIGWEVGLASGAEDILYVDETGLLTVVETKLRKNPEARREVVGQILEYAAQMATWTSADVERQAEKFFASPEAPKVHAGFSLEKAMGMFLQAYGTGAGFSYVDFLGRVQTNIERGHFRLVIAIDEPPAPLLKTVEFVNRFSERFEMYLVQLKRFRDEATRQNIFVPALFGRVARPPGPPGRSWDKESFLQQASQKSPGCLPVLQRLIAFAEGEKAIVWGRGASVGSFQFVLPMPHLGPNRRSLPAFFVMANGKMSFDFWTLKKWLNPEIVASYRDDLARAQDIPGEAISTDTWKEFDVTVLASAKSWNVLKRAVRNLAAASSLSSP